MNGTYSFSSFHQCIAFLIPMSLYEFIYIFLQTYVYPLNESLTGVFQHGRQHIGTIMASYPCQFKHLERSVIALDAQRHTTAEEITLHCHTKLIYDIYLLSIVYTE